MTINVSVPAGSYYRINCALVLEDEPVGEDSRLDFETFPESVEEVYALTSYREIGADRMPQPGGVAYRGGNWSTFSISLSFRAGERSNTERAAREPTDYTRARFEQELREMERKARWCQALCFPLRRDLGEFGRRIEQNAARSGATSSEAVRQALGELRRNDPPKVLVVFGSWMVIRGYATNVSLKWESPWDPVTNRPHGCTVSVQIQPLMVNYPTWQSIRAGAWSQPASTLDGMSIPSGAAQIQDDERAKREARIQQMLGASSPDAGTTGTARAG